MYCTLYEFVIRVKRKGREGKEGIRKGREGIRKGREEQAGGRRPCTQPLKVETDPRAVLILFESD